VPPESDRNSAREIRRARANNQLDLFDMLDGVEQTPEDFLKRDLRPTVLTLSNTFYGTHIKIISGRLRSLDARRAWPSA
jgi:hypothetical protein